MNSSFKGFIVRHVLKLETIWLLGLGFMCLLRLSFFLDVARFEIDRLILYQVDDAFYYPTLFMTDARKKGNAPA